jgi:hypothetical protein
VGSADEVFDTDVAISDESDLGIIHDSADGSEPAPNPLAEEEFCMTADRKDPSPDILGHTSSDDQMIKSGSSWEVSSCSADTSELLASSDAGSSGAMKLTDLVICCCAANEGNGLSFISQSQC